MWLVKYFSLSFFLYPFLFPNKETVRRVLVKLLAYFDNAASLLFDYVSNYLFGKFNTRELSVNRKKRLASPNHSGTKPVESCTRPPSCTTLRQQTLNVTHYYLRLLFGKASNTTI